MGIVIDPVKSCYNYYGKIGHIIPQSFKLLNHLRWKQNTVVACKVPRGQVTSKKVWLRKTQPWVSYEDQQEIDAGVKHEVALVYQLRMLHAFEELKIENHASPS